MIDTTPVIRVKQGIAYFEEPYRVNALRFSFEHLDCLSIVVDKKDTSIDEIEVIGYSTSKNDNEKLIKVYKQEYANRGYILFQHLSSSEVNCID